MKLIYLKEGRNYSADDLHSCIAEQVGERPDWLDVAFLEGLKDSINVEFGKSVVKGKANQFVFHYLGLYDYVDKSGHNLTFFFMPKFVDFQDGSDCLYDGDEFELVGAVNQNSWAQRIQSFRGMEQNAVLRAIDRYNKEQGRIAERNEIGEKKRDSVLELAVRMLRDYLENGLYTVSRHEVEANGQGEIDWNETIDQCQPVFVDGRPCYVNVLTQQAYADEEHYITRLHKCLVTQWGNKLEALGLASVLRVSVPPLSEEDLDHFGDVDFQVVQINRELNVQFVTKSRETLSLLKELILRTSENVASQYESLSFGMTGVEHLWETACAEVFGTELEKEMTQCGFPDAPQGLTFGKYMPRVFWTNLVPDEAGANDAMAFNADKGSQRSKKAGWRLDFIRTWRPNPAARAEKLVILDAKYYCARWKDGSLNGQPGTPDIAKQMFYQMAFYDLINSRYIVNAFLLPEDDQNARYNLNGCVRITETVRLESRSKEDERFAPTEAFKGINLFTVRIPGMRLLERYANYEIANDWFEKIVEFNAATKHMGSQLDKDLPLVQPMAEVQSIQHISNAMPSDAVKVVKSARGEPDNNLEATVSPMELGGPCISKAFIRDVVSVPSVSGMERMLKSYICRFAEKRGIAWEADSKGNLYLTKGVADGYYPCLVNHMDTVQDGQAAYVDRHERLPVCERIKDGKTVLYVDGMGIGADDKLGCAIALALLDRLPVVKAVFFVEEELGMRGSKEMQTEWFADVGFCLSFDSPERNRSSRTCAGVQMYSTEFFEKILRPVCTQFGISQFNDEQFTDVVQIRNKTQIMCYNVGNGGYKAHKRDEYLIVEDAQAAYSFGLDLMHQLGTRKYWFE